MIVYIKISTLEYPLHEGDIRLDHPEIPEELTYPNFPCPDTYAPIDFPPRPEHDLQTQTCEKLPAQLVNGSWVGGWSEIRQLTEEELLGMAALKRQYEQNTFLQNRSLSVPGNQPNVIR